MQTTTTYLTELPAFLTWQAGSELLKQSCSAHIHWMWRRLHDWTMADDRATWDAIVRLPAASQARLLLAPQCFRLLCRSLQPSAADRATLHAFLAMEECLLTPDRRGAPPRSWTALGDYYSGDGNVSDPIMGESGELSGDRPFRAATLGRIVLDTASPHERLALKAPGDAQVDTRIPCTPSEVAASRRQVEAGLDYVRAMSPCAATMVHNAVQVLQIGRLTNSPSATGSCSWRELIGAVGLANPDGPRWNPARVAEALIHESIHQTIYKLELTGELFTDLRAASTLSAVSPWSGRNLRMTSFVHACFVWFGLWHFWRLCPQTDKRVAALQARAYRGFEGDGPLAVVSGDAGACVLPATRDAIAAAYELVKAA